MKTNPVNYFAGLSLVLLGLLFLANSVFGDQVNFWALAWPIFVLLPGLFFWMLWKNTGDQKKSWGLLIPATILIIFAITFFFNMLITELLNYGTIWAWTAFMYVGAVAVALWISWTVSGYRPLLVAAKVLAIIALVTLVIVGGSITLFTLLSDQSARIIGPILIILLGLLIIFGSHIWRLVWPQGHFLGKTEEEWRKWGENLSQQVEEQEKTTNS